MYRSKRSLIIFIRTYTVNYRNALDRLRVRMNIIFLVIIIAKDDNKIAAVQFEIKLFDFFYWSKQLTDHIYTDVYCKLLNALDRLRVCMNIILFLSQFFPNCKILV